MNGMCMEYEDSSLQPSLTGFESHDEQSQENLKKFFSKDAHIFI